MSQLEPKIDNLITKIKIKESKFKIYFVTLEKLHDSNDWLVIQYRVWTKKRKEFDTIISLTYDFRLQIKSYKKQGPIQIYVCDYESYRRCHVEINNSDMTFEDILNDVYDSISNWNHIPNVRQYIYEILKSFIAISTSQAITEIGNCFETVKCCLNCKNLHLKDEKSDPCYSPNLECELFKDLDSHEYICKHHIPDFGEFE